jgi:hypothetical protein
LNKEEEIKKCLTKTVNHVMYNGWSNSQTKYGYHSYNFSDIEIKGQRNPIIRLNNFRNFFDFYDKNVIDFGCNVGSMLHHLVEIKAGLGFDYDLYCIEAAKDISNILGRRNLNFIKHDFDKDRYSDLLKCIYFKPDVIFLLSIGSWVSSWLNLYEICLSYNCNIFLETNNEQVNILQLEFFKKRNLNIELVSDNSNDDITGNFGRKTYFIYNKK